MAKSQSRTTAAVLRSLINKDVETMAEFLDCSIDAVKSIESGRMKLSESMAERMFHEFGISKRWLLAGDVSVPPIAANREPYSFEHFERAQADKGHYEQVQPFFVLDEVVFANVRVARILEAANGQKRFHVARFKIREALEELEEVFRVEPDSGNPQAARDLLAEQQRYFETIDSFTPSLEQPSPKPRKRGGSKRNARRPRG